MKSILILTFVSTLASAVLIQKTSPLHEEILLDMENSMVDVSGVDLFLKNPSDYNFLCTSTSKGEVLSASLSENEEMVIRYASFWDDGDHSGITEGNYNREKNYFQGTYKTNDGRFSGEINFSFNEKGEAQGTWDNGYGDIRISLKNKENDEKQKSVFNKKHK